MKQFRAVEYSAGPNLEYPSQLSFLRTKPTKVQKSLHVSTYLVRNGNLQREIVK